MRNVTSSKQTVFSPGGAFQDKNIGSMIEEYAVKRNPSRKIERQTVVDALNRDDIKTLRYISNKFYSTVPVYTNFVEYYANLNCYYWMVTPNTSYMLSEDSETPSFEELTARWYSVLSYIENINPEVIGPLIARKVLVDGVCYVAVKEKTTLKSPTSFGLQYLPIEYCRSRKRVGNRSVVEFNVRFFEDVFKDDKERLAALKMFPKPIAKEYFAYKKQNSKVKGSEWRTIDPECAFKFSLRPDDLPYYIGLVLDILDLQDTKDITMFKLEQELSKIIIQKFALDKNTNQPIADLDEMQSFHSDLLKMIGGVPGLEGMTTYADISSIDLSGQPEGVNNNPVKRSSTAVYDSAGLSQALFGGDTSGTLSKSIILDEANMKTMIRQINSFLETLVRKNFQKDKFKHIEFKTSVLEITQFNKLEMAKIYKEQMSLGYSKFLPGIALGMRQSEIMSTLVFENDVLDMVNLMRPPVTSNTTSGKDLDRDNEEKSAGREKLSDDKKSDKTEENQESM